MLQKNHHLANISDNENSLSEEKLMEKLVRKYTPRPYSQIWKPSYIGALVISWFFNAYSFGTGAFAIGFFLSHHFAWLYSTGIIFSFVLAIGAGSALELLKRNNATNFFQSGLAEKDWRGGYFFGMLLLTGISIGLSFYGSLHVPTATTTPPIPAVPVQIDLGKIESDFEQQALSLEENIKDLESKNSYRGIVSRSVRDDVANMRTKLSKLPEKRDSTLSAARAENADAIRKVEAYNKDQMQAYLDQATGLGYTLGYIAIVTELLFLMCMFYVENYLYKCALERMNGNKHSPTHLPSNIVTNPIQSHTNPNLNPVITQANNTGNSNPNQAPPSTQTQPIIQHPDRIRIIGFVSDKQDDTQDPTDPTNHCTMNTSPVHDTEKIVLKNTYTHHKTDGSQVEMTLAQIRSRVNQYERKMDEHAAKIAQGEDGYKPLLDSAKDQFLYWKKAEEDLKRKLEQID